MAPPRGFGSRSTRPPGPGPFARWLRSLRLWLGRLNASDLATLSEAELLDLADGAVKRNKPVRAAKILSAFGERTTLDPKLLVRFGDLSVAIGAHESAVISYLRAAELHGYKGEVAKGAALLAQLVRVYPEQLDARLAIARSLESLGRNKEAALHLAAAAKLFASIGDHCSAESAAARAQELLEPRARSSSLPPPPSRPPSIVPIPRRPSKQAPPPAEEVDLGSIVIPGLDSVDPTIAPTVAIGAISPPPPADSDTIYMPEVEALYSQPVTRLYAEEDAPATLLDAGPPVDLGAPTVVTEEGARGPGHRRQRNGS